MDAISELRKANTAYPHFIIQIVAGYIDIFSWKGYCDVIIEWIIDQKIEYIHHNIVEATYVANPESMVV